MSQKSNQKARNSKYQRKKEILRRRRRITYTVLIAIGIGLILYVLYRPISNAIIKYEYGYKSEYQAPRDFSVDTTVVFDGRFQPTFDDIQEVQIEAAIANGIEPLPDAKAIDSLRALGRLVDVPECALYEIEEVSLPYLIPDAKALLDVIAIRYQQRKGEPQQLRLTGCLRTDESIAHLMRGNRNSVKNSCHLYGTTFDISYRFLEYPDKKLLAQVLYELQQAGHCYVKYERKQPCFHITLR